MRRESPPRALDSRQGVPDRKAQLVLARPPYKPFDEDIAFVGLLYAKLDTNEIDKLDPNPAEASSARADESSPVWSQPAHCHMRVLLFTDLAIC
jgi:hypothetical protein